MKMKEERKNRGWTQQHAAEQLGISRSTYTNIETGHRKLSFSLLVKFEDLFEMDYRKLFDLPKRPNGSST